MNSIEDCMNNLIQTDLRPFFPSLPANFKSISLGKSTGHGTRPLKVSFPSKNLVLKLISDFNTGMRVALVTMTHGSLPLVIVIVIPLL